MAKSFTLADGRKLEYAVHGPAAKHSLIFNHGTPGGWPAQQELVNACTKKGIQMITFSRAGYGNSSRRKGRKVVDEVEDIQALMSHLGIKETFIGGWSGGGPSALACAARLEGCKAALVVASVCPYTKEEGFDWMAGQGQDNVEELNEAFKGEAELSKFCEAMRKELISSDEVSIVETMSSILPESDKKAIRSRPAFGKSMVENFQVGLQHNADGWVDDDLAMIEDWGFNVDEAKVPLFLYQGSDDLMVPYAHGEWLVKHLPNKYTTTHLEQGEGHISIFFDKEEFMLDELLHAASS